MTQPKSYLKVCNSTGVDSEYQHTRYFDDKAQQKAFWDKQPAIFETKNGAEYQYIREDGSVKIACHADIVSQANYIIFTNNVSPVNRTIYGFIIDVIYVSENCCTVYFDIDIMQTYLFDWVFKQCLVEREHTYSDKLFEHFVPEGLGGEKEVNSFVQSDMSWGSTGFSCCIQYANKQGSFAIYNDTVVAHQSKYYHFGIERYEYIYDEDGALTDVIDHWQEACNAMSNDIADLIKNDNTIIDVFLYPAWLDSHTTRILGLHIDMPETFKGREIVDSYYPKNRKMYTNEFMNVVISNLGDTQKKYAPEKVCKIVTSNVDGEQRAYLRTLVDNYIEPRPEMLVLPWGETELFDDKLYEKGVACDCAIRLSWSENAFATWVADNSTKAILNTVLSGLLAVAGVALGAATGGAGAGVGVALGKTAATIGTSAALANTVSSISSAAQAGSTAATFKASSVSSYMFNHLGVRGYALYVESISSEQARVIDDYFTRYGYKVNELKTPSRRNRQRFTYLKTAGCTIEPLYSAKGDVGITETIKRRIQSICDNGITWWWNDNKIGVYDYNHPLGV